SGAVRQPAPSGDRGDRSARGGSAARALHRPASGASREHGARTRRAGAALSQSPRLCAAHALPPLRLSARLSQLRRLAGRSPLPPPLGLPSLRILDAAPAAVPALPGI